MARDEASTLLAVPHLRRFWERSTAERGGEVDAAETAADMLVIHGLALGLHDTFRFLHEQRPEFAVFERWVLDRNGGSVPPERAAWINGAVRRVLAGRDGPGPGLPPGFEPAFTADEIHFWEENGYVVLRGAVTPEAAAAAAEAIWAHLGMAPARPDSWYEDSRCDGIMVHLARHPAFDANRRPDRIRRAFAQLCGTEELYVTVDHGGFIPPERPGHTPCAHALHWDTSLAPPIPPRISGVLYLTDTPADQAAFRCVPGFHRRIEAWLARLPAGSDPRGAALSAEAVPVAGRAGDMVLWHAALPHAAGRNLAAAPRLVQYLSWQPSGFVDRRPWI